MQRNTFPSKCAWILNYYYCDDLSPADFQEQCHFLLCPSTIYFAFVIKLWTVMRFVPMVLLSQLFLHTISKMVWYHLQEIQSCTYKNEEIKSERQS